MCPVASINSSAKGYCSKNANISADNSVTAGDFLGEKNENTFAINPLYIHGSVRAKREIICLRLYLNKFCLGVQLSLYKETVLFVQAAGKKYNVTIL